MHILQCLEIENSMRREDQDYSQIAHSSSVVYPST